MQAHRLFLALVLLGTFTTAAGQQPTGQQPADQPPANRAPEATARSEPSPIVQEDDPRISDHAVVTRVIDISDLRFPDVTGQDGAPVGAAAQHVPVLRPLMGISVGTIAAIPGINKLVVVDRYDNVRRIAAIVDELRQ